MFESAYIKIQKLVRRHIQVYNIVSGKFNTRPTVEINMSRVSNTRGNMYKMQLTHMHYKNTSLVI